MGKKSFTADADDIFGGYAAEKPKKTAVTKQKETKKEYALHLVAFEQNQLEKLQALAWYRKTDVKQVLEEMLEEKLEQVENLSAMLDAYQKER